MCHKNNNKKNDIITDVLAVIFILLLFFGFFRSGAYGQFDKIAEYLKQSNYDSEDAITIEKIESEYASNIGEERELIDFNGLMAKRLDMRGYYGNIGIYISDEGYIISPYPQTTTDYEYVETVLFRDFLEDRGINLIYVNAPTKYTEDSVFVNQFGVESYSNRNMDLFLNRIMEEGIPCIDLRKNVTDEDKNILSMFYRTDHHWTTESGLWAAKKIANGLNEYCGYHIDPSIYDINNYNVTRYNNCWLGEQGKKVGATYVGLDDYSEIEPSFETSFVFLDNGRITEGTFGGFINKEVYNTEKDVYENPSWHNSYRSPHCINNNIEDGKVLIIGDSFNYVVHPFLALGVHELDSVILRECPDAFNLRDYIIENGYDTVIISYSQIMLGAHDDETSSNYKMYQFD